jgi:hypothetical protein
MSFHVLGQAMRLPKLLLAEIRSDTRISGLGLRLGIVATSLVVGLVLAAATLELAEPWLRLPGGIDG